MKPQPCLRSKSCLLSSRVSGRAAAWFRLSALCAMTACVAPDEVTLEGRLQNLVLDGPEPGQGRVLHVLETEAGEVELLFPGAVELATGSPLRVSGRYLDAAVPGTTGFERRLLVRTSRTSEVGRIPAAKELAAHEQPLILDPARAPPPRKLAVFLFNFKNDDRQPITPDEVRRKIFTDRYSSRAFYKEQSYGVLDLVGKADPQGDVFGWYTIPAFNRPCSQAVWADAAIAAAKAAGVDTEGYDHQVFFFPATDACAYLGLGQMPGRRTWVNGASVATFTHELGHNIGTPHASARACTDRDGNRVTLSDSCTDSEYGNPFDVMGAGFLHTHAYNKAQARWLTGTNIEYPTRIRDLHLAAAGAAVPGRPAAQHQQGRIHLLSRGVSSTVWLRRICPGRARGQRGDRGAGGQREATVQLLPARHEPRHQHAGGRAVASGAELRGRQGRFEDHPGDGLAQPGPGQARVRPGEQRAPSVGRRRGNGA